MLKKIIPSLAGGFLALLLAAGPAPAADTAIRTGLSRGSRSSTEFDLYLQHTFEPWHERAGYTFGPYANLGYMLWVADNKENKPQNDQLWGLVAALGLRWDWKTWETAQPYFAFNVGPSYVSDNEFMDRQLGGGHYLFNLRASLGLRLGESQRHNLGLDASHCSNAYTKSSNNGYNALGLSYGYSFW